MINCWVIEKGLSVVVSEIGVWRRGKGLGDRYTCSCCKLMWEVLETRSPM